MTRCEDVEVDVPYDSALLSRWDLWKRVKRVMVSKGNYPQMASIQISEIF